MSLLLDDKNQKGRQPERAFQNWMGRDVAFGKWVATRTRALGLNFLLVDGKLTLAENAAIVEAHFQAVDSEPNQKSPTS